MTAKRPNVLAIVLAGGEGKRLMPLTADRAKPAVPFAGDRHRLIDFALSNVVNSGYLKVVVLTQYKSHRNSILTAVAIAAFCPQCTCRLPRGQPFTPAGANFSISAVQGINTGSPTGATGVSPQVNGDFEFKDSIGVSYDQGNGQLKDFGLGLYRDSAHQTQSTGLRVTYAAPVDAFSVKVTLGRFRHQVDRHILQIWLKWSQA